MLMRAERQEREREGSEGGVGREDFLENIITLIGAIYTTFAAPRILLFRPSPRIPLIMSLTIASSIIAVLPVDVGANNMH